MVEIFRVRSDLPLFLSHRRGGISRFLSGRHADCPKRGHFSNGTTKPLDRSSHNDGGRGPGGVVNVAHEGRSTCRRRDFLARTCFFPPLSCSPSISIYIPLSLFPFRVKSVIAGRLRERKREGERVMENIPVAILVRRPDDRKRRRREKENVRVRGEQGGR